MDYFEHVDEQIDLDMVQLTRDCADSVDAKVDGNLKLSFDVVSEPEVGGIIESVESTSELELPEVTECIRESAYVLDLPPYPDGPGRMQFSFAIEIVSK
jgi:hypothetical protein